MPGVMVPQRKQGDLQAILPLAGSAIGGAFGGPAGAAVGGAVGGKLGEQKPGPEAIQGHAIQEGVAPQAAPDQQGAPDYGDAVTRRLSQADQAASQLPPDQQDIYGPIIRRAQMLDAQQRGYA